MEEDENPGNKKEIQTLNALANPLKKPSPKYETC
jgi:hypothetical protein